VKLLIITDMPRKTGSGIASVIANPPKSTPVPWCIKLFFFFLSISVTSRSGSPPTKSFYAGEQIPDFIAPSPWAPLRFPRPAPAPFLWLW
jgi:hypothetical protein